MTKQSEMAQKVLDSVTMYPDNFDMLFYINGPAELKPTMPVEDFCVTTLCAAGWAALHDGYSMCEAYGAKKNGVEFPGINKVGAEAFDLDDEEGIELFYASNDTALAVLKRMASGERYTSEMLYEEQARTVRAARAEQERA